MTTVSLRILLATTLLGALGACASGYGASNETPSVASAVAAEPALKPELGEFGIELDTIDTSIRPQDDFYQFVNGKWLVNFEIPADRSNYGSFTKLAERSEERTREIIESSAAKAQSVEKGTETQQVGDLYASFMDEGRINSLGLAPIASDLAEIAAAETHDEIAMIMAQNVRANGTSPFNFFFNVDSKNPDAYAVYFTQSGLSLPDRDYYLEDSEKSAALREAFERHVTSMMDLADIDGAEEKAAKTLELETAMAEVFWSRAESRNRDKTYNPMTIADMETSMPGFPWAAFASELEIDGQGQVIVRQPSSLAGMTEIFAKTPVDVWKAYLQFHAISDAAPYLSAAFVEENFDFSGRTLSGVPELRSRWKRGVSLVNRTMGEAVGKLYVAEHFPPVAKERMDVLVENLRAAYGDRIRKLDWMGEDTKVEALDKLAKFTPKIGYPEKWRDYSAIDIRRDDLVGNLRRAAAAEYDRQVSRLNDPIDRTEWFITPQTVNAYYSPNRNEIVFPAAILQPPFFDPAADDAVNYGAIGAVIGHEMGHGFDDQGRKSDGEGRLRDWWQPEDVERFKARSDKLVAQYDGYAALPGEFVNGRFTLGENIGDLGGLEVAYYAYKISLDGKPAPVIAGYTGDQRFFMAWAQVWRRLYRDAELSRRLKSDPHSPSSFRTNGIVRNIDAWYAAFNVKEDDELYLPPEERVQIW
ncbi:MAG: M13-type metalloendopeptidase [Pseudomonadota bacterium]